MRMVFVTDLHGSTRYLARLTEESKEVELLLLGGDLTQFGEASAAQQVLRPLREAFKTVRGVAGNLDGNGVTRWLSQEGLSLHGQGERWGELGIMGCGGSNATPMQTPQEYSEEDMSLFLKQGHHAVAEAPIRVVVSHAPPHRTALDQLEGGQHVGSGALRSFLEAQQPALCLCGHIHEARGADRVGDTWVLNPGPFFSGNYALVDVGVGEVNWELCHIESGCWKKGSWQAP